MTIRGLGLWRERVRGQRAVFSDDRRAGGFLLLSGGFHILARFHPVLQVVGAVFVGADVATDGLPLRRRGGGDRVAGLHAKHFLLGGRFQRVIAGRIGTRVLELAHVLFQIRGIGTGLAVKVYRPQRPYFARRGALGDRGDRRGHPEILSIAGISAALAGQKQVAIVMLALHERLENAFLAIPRPAPARLGGNHAPRARIGLSAGLGVADDLGVGARLELAAGRIPVLCAAAAVQEGQRALFLVFRHARELPHEQGEIRLRVMQKAHALGGGFRQEQQFRFVCHCLVSGGTEEVGHDLPVHLGQFQVPLVARIGFKASGAGVGQQGRIVEVAQWEVRIGGRGAREDAHEDAILIHPRFGVPGLEIAHAIGDIAHELGVRPPGAGARVFGQPAHVYDDLGSVHVGSSSTSSEPMDVVNWKV